MQIHILFFTVWIAKRQYSQAEVQREIKYNEHLEQKRALQVKQAEYIRFL